MGVDGKCVGRRRARRADVVPQGGVGGIVRQDGINVIFAVVSGAASVTT